MAEQLDQDFLDDVSTIDSDRLGRYSTFGDYYDGEHKTQVSDRARMYLEASGLRFCENFCEPVVDVEAERLRVTGFQVEDKTGDQTTGETSDLKQLEEELAARWERSGGDLLQATVHAIALVKGDAYVIPDWDPRSGSVRLWFNRPEIINPVYDDDRPDELAYAGKVWASTARGPLNPDGRPIVRLNVYWPDRIEKYFKLHQSEGKGGWAIWLDTDPDTGIVDEASWQLPWVDGAGEPLGVAVHHFRNKPLGRVFGRSELRAVVPQQDALNKQVIDLHDVLDHLAWPQRYLIAQVEDVDLQTAPGQWVKVNAENGEIGQLDPADPSGVLAAIESTLSRIARRSRTPLHLLTGGDMPSGESLKAAESGLVAKVELAQVVFGQEWERLMLMGTRVAAVNGDQDAAALVGQLDGLVVRALWDDPVSRNELQEGQSLLVDKDLGASKRTLLRKRGYDPDQEAEWRALEAAEAQATMARMFDRGNVDPSAEGTPVDQPGQPDRPGQGTPPQPGAAA